jgi:AbrB family looped-hinge helix DNA binding protein
MMHGKPVIGSMTVGAKGQVVLPVEVRKACDIKPGDTLIVMARGGTGMAPITIMKSSSVAHMLDHLEETKNKIRSLVDNGGVKPAKTSTVRRRLGK